MPYNNIFFILKKIDSSFVVIWGFYDKKSIIHSHMVAFISTRMKCIISFKSLLAYLFIEYKGYESIKNAYIVMKSRMSFTAILVMVS